MLMASDRFPVGLALRYPVALTLATVPICKGGLDASACGSGSTQARCRLEITSANHTHDNFAQDSVPARLSRPERVGWVLI